MGQIHLARRSWRQGHREQRRRGWEERGPGHGGRESSRARVRMLHQLPGKEVCECPSSTLYSYSLSSCAALSPSSAAAALSSLSSAYCLRTVLTQLDSLTLLAVWEYTSRSCSRSELVGLLAASCISARYPASHSTRFVDTRLPLCTHYGSKNKKGRRCRR
ncbi:hypothetical protein L226DRAFT_51546 [Lentinus tigrinus ALCF2SS1-7]|uniref:uncharacterized protein n=1 Tax=Lentinus tigrinus ALCF2SS1-7 TaxID=1328758 RepID=UPI0011661434|nr:hypothetical protein L226DRAFT_51546 [Lentinus tigrinus ALCF2SS1-7]